MSEVLLPGPLDDTGRKPALGVMGGGQLGRMFAQAAQNLGFDTVVLEPDEHSPAGWVAHRHIRAGYEDAAGLAELAANCDAITTEFENVPAASLLCLAALRPVAPAGAAVAICQDRAAEKAHFVRSAVACAPNALIETKIQAEQVDVSLLPGILKTNRMGYDGKGQRRVANAAELVQAWLELGSVPCLLEQMLPLALELSVIVARNAAGQVVQLPVQQNLHINGILAHTMVPAPDVSTRQQALAMESATRIAQSMDYVGVLCVEFFVLQDGRLVANEMAPRPHNSGHYSIDACDVSQFELQVRAMAGLPLVQPRLHSPAVMLNILGDLWIRADGQIRSPDWAAVLALPGVHLHLYGKPQARPGRKMGHITVTAASLQAARDVALQVGQLLQLPGALQQVSA